MRDEFSTLDIVKALGIERECLREWVNRSFIEPSVPAPSQGKKAVFSRLDVYGVELFRQLVSAGLDRSKCRIFVNFYKERMLSDHGDLNYMGLRLGPLKEDGIDVAPSGSAFFPSHGDKILLDVGFADSKDLERSRGRYDNQWSIMHLVNLKVLRSKVDFALEKL